MLDIQKYGGTYYSFFELASIICRSFFGETV